MSSETRKILVIGAEGYARAKDGLRLDCVSWEKLSQILNVRDYDVLLINLLSISADASRKRVDWMKFNALLDFPAASDILVHKGTIVVLGDPRFEIPSKDTATKDFLDWTGATFMWDNQPGDTVKFSQSGDYGEFENYGKYFRNWEYSLAGCRLNESAVEGQWSLDKLRRKNLTPVVRVFAACSNRYGHSLAFCVQHQLLDGYDRTHLALGFIYLLPKISLDEDETLQIVLSDFCAAASELPEPEWLSSFEVPGQKPIEEQISNIKATITEQQGALEKAISDRANCRACLKLLYEREFALEPIVREILRELGATVEEPVEKNKEDGWIAIQLGGATYEGVLEIKSTKSDQFNEDGRRQLLDWIGRGQSIRGKNYKGIFIGNSAVTKKWDDRPDAFSASWKKAAALSQICAIKTEALFIIYVLHKEGKLSRDDFWITLFKTDGIFDIKPLLPKVKSSAANQK